MSNAVLPSYIGIRLEVDKAPIWSTRLAEAASGFERRVQETVYPRKWSITLSVEVLRDQAGLDEAKNLLGFFNLRGGRFDSFLYADPDDNAVTDFQFGIRDGVATQFQLTRPIGTGSFAFLEPVQNVNALTNIKSNGVAIASPADYSISATGLVTLTAPGTAGHVLTWTGSYYWRVRFDEDRMPFSKMFQGLWALKKLPLIGSVTNKV
jgi:uncharacterized protein (TIGR02217 family)